jgi:hypothetical protein
MFKGENTMICNLIKTPRVSFQVAMLAGTMLVSSSGFTAGQCKGMQQAACAAAEQCAWVNGYLRKDGRSVSSHCKAKPARKTADQAALDTLKLGRTR